MARPWLAGLLAAPTLLPIGATLAALLNPWSEHWPHLLSVVLPDVLGNTLALALLVALGAGTLGTGLAWLTARYSFPGRPWLHAGLMLPLAMPGYVLGFVLIAGLDYAGPVQSAWRDLSGTDGALWQIRGLGGTALTLTLTLYPYVYLITRQAFVSLSADTLEAAQLLGLPRRQLFWRVALPLAAPWMIGALLLVTMEVLADFGTVALFNLDTFTTAIYKSWFGFFDLSAALQLASLLILIAAVLVWWHRRQQGRGRRDQNPARPLPRIQLSGRKALLASAALTAFVMLTAGLPLAVLASWSWQHLSQELDPRYLGWLGHSLGLASLAALCLVTAALLMAVLERASGGRLVPGFARGASLGYALPGPLIAVGLFAVMAGVERLGAPLLAPGWVTQSLALVLLGYWARFFTVAFTPISQQMNRLTPSLDEVCRSLGYTGWRLIRHLHLPLLGGSLATAAALVLIDVFKEMPITLMLRPLGWDTLATRVFELTAEGEYQRAALPALSIVLAGVVPVALLLREPRNRMGTT